MTNNRPVGAEVTRAVPMTVEERRLAVEKIIGAAAMWGWLQGRRGCWWRRRFERPVIVWNEAGEPEITNGVW